MKWEPARTPAGSACILGLLFARGWGGDLGFFLFLDGILESEDREVRAVHAAKIAAAAFFGVDRVGRVIPLGVEGGGERQDVGGAKLHAEATRLTAFHYDLYRSFGHFAFP